MSSGSAKKFFQRARILLLAILLCPPVFGTSVPEAAEKKRTVRIPCGINSLLYLDASGEPAGNCNAYLDKLAEINNWEYEYVDTTWTEAVEMLGTGEIDLLFPTNYTPERAEAMDFSSLAGGYVAPGLFTKADSGYYYEDFASFNGAKIAVTKDTSNELELIEFAKNRGFTYEPVYIDSAEEKTRALEQGEVDMVIFNASNELPNAVLAAVLEAQPFYYTVKSGNDTLLTELNHGMQQLLNSFPDLVADTQHSCLVGNNPSSLALTEREREFIESGTEIVIGFYENTEPLAYVSDDGNYDGIYIRLLENIRETSGLNLTFRPVSRNESWQELLAGHDIDFYIGSSAMIAVEDPLLCTTDPLLEYENVLITDYKCRFTELDVPKIALTQGRAYWADYLESMLGEAEITYYRTAKECLNAVQSGRADATLLNNIEFNYHTKNDRFSTLIQWEPYRFTSGVSLTAAADVDSTMFSVFNKSVGFLQPEYTDAVVNEYLNMPYVSADLMDILYTARFILAGFSFIILVLLTVGISILRIRRLRAEAQRREAEIEKHQLKIVAALSRSYTAIYYVNLNTDSFETIRTASPEKTAACGFLPSEAFHSEALRQYVNTYVREEHRESLLALCEPLAIHTRLKEETDFSIRYQVKPNAEHMDFYEMHFVDVSTDENELVMVSGIRCVDEAARQEREQRQLLMDSLEAAKRASLAKSDFMSKMSHDIRTPMNAIIGMTTIASANVNAPERVQDALNKITTSSRHLLGLINEVLDMSKIESGTISLTEEAFNLSEQLNSLLVMVQPQIESHHHSLSVHTKNICHEDVVGDSLRIQQVFVNILSNAIKYTPDGGKITLSVEEQPMRTPKLGCYQFVFEDNGIGMSPEYLEHLFEPFSREEDLRTSKIQGTGLGMAITHGIVQLMNGSIKVESEVGKGSRFTVTIFLKVQDSQELDYSALAGLPVLVVDDDPDVCESLNRLLDELGMKGESYTSGQEALEAVRNRRKTDPALHAAILDWRMPGMDGLETLKALKEQLGQSFPVIILSAYDRSDVETEAKEAGVDAFLSKPVFKSGLIRVFRQLQNGENAQEGNSQSLQALESKDYSNARLLLVEDNILNREIAREILKMAGLRPDEAENGREAVEKFAASEPGYYDLILMDIQMPLMNGYEATKAIRALNHPDAAKIPIVAMTADAFVEDIEAARAAGMNDHLSKPIELKKLSAALQKYLG
ncbi:MAG: response regulator [Blautia sp.]|nr:response regulator [Blautia sp.]